MEFYLKAYKKDFRISVPFGESAKYDLILDSGKKLHRVQVKSVGVKDTKRRNNRYHISVSYGRPTKHQYTKDQVDFVICYVIPEDVWYIIPVEILQSVRISLFPDRDIDGGNYERFKEAWSSFANLKLTP